MIVKLDQSIPDNINLGKDLTWIMTVSGPWRIFLICHYCVIIVVGVFLLMRAATCPLIKKAYKKWITMNDVLNSTTT